MTAPLVRIAAFTMAYNEAAFLPIWLAHYGAQLGRENLFVLDHGSTDGSTEGLAPTQCLRLARDGAYDEGWRVRLVGAFQAMLLCQYEAVIFADTDELLVADPARFPDLRSLVAARATPSIRALGLDVMHLPQDEPPLDLARPVLAQRGYVQFSPKYCKTLVSRVALAWKPGFHRVGAPEPPVCPELYLFHLKGVDRDLALAAQPGRRAIAWTQHGLDNSHGTQFRFSDAELLERYFGNTRQSVAARLADGFDFAPQVAAVDRGEWPRGVVARIPDAFRGLIPAPLQP